MAYNGSGAFTVDTAGNPVVTQTSISSTVFNSTMQEMATGLSTAICKDGQTTITQNLPMANHKFTGMLDGSARADSATIGNVVDGTGVYSAVVGGTADVITLTPSPATTAYVAGQTFRFIAGGANTTNVTVAVSGLAAKAITKNGTTALVAGDIPSGAMVTITYDGTRFILGTVGAATVPASIPTTYGVITPADNVFRITGSADTTKKLAFEVDGVTTGQTRTATAPDYDIRLANIPAGIGPLPYSGASIPTGWLECDGSAVSRTTYANLFSAIGTTWGGGDGSSTFNLPDFRNRAPIGAGTGTVVEIVTASSGNGFTVSSNNEKWITGQSVVWSALSGFTTTGSEGPTYYVVRISATNIRFATTLALAQALTPDITISGSGSCTLSHTFTARTLGEYGGTDSHAQTVNELYSHNHPFNNATSVVRNIAGAVAAGGADKGSSTLSANATGGNTAMTIKNPYGVVKFIISY